MSMGTRYMVGYSYLGEEGIEFLILTTPIGLNGKNFAIKERFNKSLELLELLENFRFVFEEIYPCKFAEIIDKAHIIFISAN
jgi:hypothetical protein